MPITAMLHSRPNHANPAIGPKRRPEARPTARQSSPATAAKSSIHPVPPIENMRPRLELRWWGSPTRGGLRSVQGRYDDLAAGHHRDVAAQRDVDRVGQAPDRPAALVELRDVDLHPAEVPRPQLLDDARRCARRHHYGAADHDRVRAE